MEWRGDVPPDAVPYATRRARRTAGFSTRLIARFITRSTRGTTSGYHTVSAAKASCCPSGILFP